MKTGAEGPPPGQTNGDAIICSCGSFTEGCLTRDQQKTAAGFDRPTIRKSGVK